VQRSPRGRKAVLDQDMLDLFEQLTPGAAVVITGFGNVEKDKRSAVSANIRKHFTAVHGEDTKCRIDYSPGDNFPQVRFPK
jgi:hypothetical protein